MTQNIILSLVLEFFGQSPGLSIGYHQPYQHPTSVLRKYNKDDLFPNRHDDYDYSQINQLLERNLKMFLKTVTCFPERLSSLEASPFIMKGFLNSEKVSDRILSLIEVLGSVSC